MNISRLYPAHRAHQSLSDPRDFADQHVRQFEQLGFVAVENIFSASEAESAKAALSFLIAGGNPAFTTIDFEDSRQHDALPPDQREPYVRKLMWFTGHEPTLKTLSEHPRLLSIVRRLLGADVRMIQDMALLKPPHVGREKPWHQDAAYFLYEPPQAILGTWTALDEATADNGCMHVIPGSHLRGPQPHYHDRDCQLPDDSVDVAGNVIVPLKPETLFFSSLLHHGTPPNCSPARRRALQFHYARSDIRKIDEATHAMQFKDRHGYAACTDSSTGKAGRPISQRA